MGGWDGAQQRGAEWEKEREEQNRAEVYALAPFFPIEEKTVYVNSIAIVS